MLARTDTQREIYEGREKALRDERARMYHATTEGYERGLRKGALIGRVETLEGLLGQEPTKPSDLESMSAGDLQRMADELRQQLGR